MLILDQIDYCLHVKDFVPIPFNFCASLGVTRPQRMIDERLVNFGGGKYKGVWFLLFREYT